MEHNGNIVFDSAASIGSLKPASLPVAGGVLRFGIPHVDRWLHGGLRRDGVHEFYAAAAEDRASAAAFSLLLVERVGRSNPVMWLRPDGRSSEKRHPFPPGLIEMGIDLDRFILARLGDRTDLLKAAVDSIRHGGLGAVILELGKRSSRIDLTTSRRLALAAERSGTMVLILFGDAVPEPSAAHSRWQVASAPSTPLPANAPGHPVFDLTLLRQRGGQEGLHVQLEWDREQACFRTPLSGGASAVPAGGSADRRASRAA
tara:strand:- start:220 stop:996 length:777 start_codon:yes stop_codon:yes gene_type:complete